MFFQFTVLCAWAFTFLAEILIYLYKLLNIFFLCPTHLCYVKSFQCYVNFSTLDSLYSYNVCAWPVNQHPVKISENLYVNTLCESLFKVYSKLGKVCCRQNLLFFLIFLCFKSYPVLVYLLCFLVLLFMSSSTHWLRRT